jgi:steroid 5-alpha reductase family enzyme
VNLLAPFLVILLVMAMVMTGSWLAQRATKNAGWVDVFWTFGCGAACVAAALWPAASASGLRQVLVAVLSAFWAVRLGVYIAHRVATGPEDARYAGLRQEWGAAFQRNMFLLAIVQAPASAVLTLSVFAAAHGGQADLGVRDLLGAVVLVGAIAGEALADEQMRQFRREGRHRAVMDRGLWGWSRHPNYFFEWLGWLAYPVIVFDPAQSSTWISWVAPVVMFVILRFGTGVPALEKTMLQSRGEAFRAYQRRVSAFFPFPPKSKPS